VTLAQIIVQFTMAMPSGPLRKLNRVSGSVSQISLILHQRRAHEIDNQNGVVDDQIALNEITRSITQFEGRLNPTPNVSVWYFTCDMVSEANIQSIHLRSIKPLHNFCPLRVTLKHDSVERTQVEIMTLSTSLGRASRLLLVSA
jgi:hypothetical protein